MIQLPENEFLHCMHLGNSSHDLKAIEKFVVSHPETGKGLELYLKEIAYREERENLMRTYLVCHKATGECAGYFSLKAGLISVNEESKGSETSFDTLPGVELANFAINRYFVEKTSTYGLGKVLFRELIAPFVLEHAETLGIFMIYLFSLPQQKLMATYVSYGFQRLPKDDEEQLHQRLKPTYDKSCIFMFQTLKALKYSIT